MRTVVLKHETSCKDLIFLCFILCLFFATNVFAQATDTACNASGCVEVASDTIPGSGPTDDAEPGPLEELLEKNQFSTLGKEISTKATDCGSGKTDCEAIGKSLNKKGKIQKVSEIANRASLGAAVIKELSKKNNQKSSLKSAGNIQKMGGLLSLTSAATSFGLALKAQKNELNELKKIQANCQNTRKDTPTDSCNIESIEQSIAELNRSIKELKKKSAFAALFGALSYERGKAALDKAKELKSKQSKKIPPPSDIDSARLGEQGYFAHRANAIKTSSKKSSGNSIEKKTSDLDPTRASINPHRYRGGKSPIPRHSSKDFNTINPSGSSVALEKASDTATTEEPTEDKTNLAEQANKGSGWSSGGSGRKFSVIMDLGSIEEELNLDLVDSDSSPLEQSSLIAKTSIPTKGKLLRPLSSNKNAKKQSIFSRVHIAIKRNVRN